MTGHYGRYRTKFDTPMKLGTLAYIYFQTRRMGCTPCLECFSERFASAQAPATLNLAWRTMRNASYMQYGHDGRQVTIKVEVNTRSRTVTADSNDE